MENYFELLEIDASASRDEIRKAYYKKLKKYHPDVYKGDKSFAMDVVTELNKAYAIFKDDDLKYLISKEYSGYKYYPILALNEDERTRHAMDNIKKYRLNGGKNKKKKEEPTKTTTTYEKKSTTTAKNNTQKTEHENYSIIHKWLTSLKKLFVKDTVVKKEEPKLTQSQQEKIDKYRLNLVITFVSIVILICIVLLFVL